MKLWDKVIIAKGRLKREVGIIIGTTNLNMEHRLIVRREKGRAGHKIMGFREDELKLRRNTNE